MGYNQQALVSKDVDECFKHVPSKKELERYREESDLKLKNTDWKDNRIIK